MESSRNMGLAPLTAMGSAGCRLRRQRGFLTLAGRYPNRPGVAPEAFKGVVLADILLKNMRHDVAKIHHDPFGGRRAFDAERGFSLGAQHVAHMICNGSRLALRLPGAQNQIIGDRG